jgi:hypothetical protein
MKIALYKSKFVVKSQFGLVSIFYSKVYTIQLNFNQTLGLFCSWHLGSLTIFDEIH